MPGAYVRGRMKLAYLWGARAGAPAVASIIATIPRPSVVTVSAPARRAGRARISWPSHLACGTAALAVAQRDTNGKPVLVKCSKGLRNACVAACVLLGNLLSALWRKRAAPCQSPELIRNAVHAVSVSKAIAKCAWSSAPSSESQGVVCKCWMQEVDVEAGGGLKFPRRPGSTAEGGPTLGTEEACDHV
ncbi:hypothetical protein NLG97_g7586 [Lecanicillium saksenae]|uniref:Uncharacterized protein n=1 Tax=Lecanicillium saksenae TaxID=468837 RepID=A0ACC1QN78_9HYPO|nr:hypothetical protein NLG97_g7586 [Lecanicillium saksenae]